MPRLPFYTVHLYTYQHKAARALLFSLLVGREPIRDLCGFLIGFTITNSLRASFANTAD